MAFRTSLSIFIAFFNLFFCFIVVAIFIGCAHGFRNVFDTSALCDKFDWFTLCAKALLLFILSYILTFITFTLFNWVLPSVRVKLSHDMIGGIVTTVLFELGKFAFSVYLNLFPTYRVLYGALSVIPIFS